MEIGQTNAEIRKRSGEGIREFRGEQVGGREGSADRGRVVERRGVNLCVNVGSEIGGNGRRLSDACTEEGEFRKCRAENRDARKREDGLRNGDSS